MGSIILEIRPGTGGEEAALFAHDLFRMYKRYVERKRWKMAVLEAEETGRGGLRSIAAAVDGPGVEVLGFDSGVHRVQRIPATERAGRIHTSTATVAVLPKPEEKDRQLRPQDLKVETFRASGPGGQYVNKRESAVRMTHMPTGIVVVSQTGRTQIQNRQYALSLLTARVNEATAQSAAAHQDELRRAQIGRAQRAEKIRTYNFPQDRLTDHRLKKSWHGLERILDGDLQQIVTAFDSEGKGRSHSYPNRV